MRSKISGKRRGKRITVNDAVEFLPVSFAGDQVGHEFKIRGAVDHRFELESLDQAVPEYRGRKSRTDRCIWSCPCCFPQRLDIRNQRVGNFRIVIALQKAEPDIFTADISLYLRLMIPRIRPTGCRLFRKEHPVIAGSERGIFPRIEIFFSSP